MTIRLWFGIGSRSWRLLTIKLVDVNKTNVKWFEDTQYYYDWGPFTIVAEPE